MDKSGLAIAVSPFFLFLYFKMKLEYFDTKQQFRHRFI